MFIFRHYQHRVIGILVLIALAPITLTLRAMGYEPGPEFFIPLLIAALIVHDQWRKKNDRNELARLTQIRAQMSPAEIARADANVAEWNALYAGMKRRNSEETK
jgi:hypothetical protein